MEFDPRGAPGFFRQLGWNQAATIILPGDFPGESMVTMLEMQHRPKDQHVFSQIPLLIRLALSQILLKFKMLHHHDS